MGRSFLDGSFIPNKKRAPLREKHGKGCRLSRLMSVIDGESIPLSLHVDSAQPNERKLVEATFARLHIPQRCGRPRTRPLVLVTVRNFDGEELRQQLSKTHRCVTDLQQGTPYFTFAGTPSVPHFGGRMAARRAPPRRKA